MVFAILAARVAIHATCSDLEVAGGPSLSAPA